MWVVRVGVGRRGTRDRIAAVMAEGVLSEGMRVGEDEGRGGGELRAAGWGSIGRCARLESSRLTETDMTVFAFRTDFHT